MDEEKVKSIWQTELPQPRTREQWTFVVVVLAVVGSLVFPVCVNIGEIHADGGYRNAPWIADADVSVRPYWNPALVRAFPELLYRAVWADRIVWWPTLLQVVFLVWLGRGIHWLVGFVLRVEAYSQRNARPGVEEREEDGK